MFMTLNFHKKPQRDFVFHFLKKIIIPYLFYFFCSLLFFHHADVHATACWRIGSYAPVNQWLWFSDLLSEYGVYELGVKNDFSKFPITSPHTKVQQKRQCDKNMFQIRTCLYFGLILYKNVRYLYDNTIN